MVYSELKLLMAANLLRGDSSSTRPRSGAVVDRPVPKKGKKKGKDNDTDTQAADQQDLSIAEEMANDKKAQDKREHEAAKEKAKLAKESKKKKERKRRGRSRSGGKTSEGASQESGLEGGSGEHKSRISSIRKLNFFNLRGNSSSIDGACSPQAELVST